MDLPFQLEKRKCLMPDEENSKSLVFQKQLINNGGDIRIGITKSGLGAYISFLPSNAARRFRTDEVYELLEKEKIVFGIDSNLIMNLVNQINEESVKVLDVQIAHGVHPKQGSDANIQYQFKINRIAELLEDEHGRVDHKNLRLINNVREGDLVAVKQSKIPGVPGCNIYGESVSPKKVHDKEIIIGNGLYLSSDRNQAFAGMDGHVYLEGRRISLSAVVVVPHDVDLKVGNIDTNGSILVYGNVLGGFTLNAKKNIEIRGVVEGATLLAGGDIVCHKGIKGGNRGLIQANGNVVAEFAETAHIKAGENLQILSSIINCHITCNGKITVRGAKGRIVGGEVQAGKGISVYDLGSKIGASTRIIVGDKTILREKIKEVQDLLQRSAHELKSSAESMQKLQPLLRMLRKLPSMKRQKLENLVKNHQAKIEHTRELQNEDRKLRALFNIPCAAKLEVRNHAFTNIFMTIGHSDKTTRLVEENMYFIENHLENRVEAIKISGDREEHGT